MLLPLESWADVKAMMFALALPTFAASMMVFFGTMGLVAKINRDVDSAISKVAFITCGCVIIAWFLYAIKIDRKPELRVSEQAIELLREEISETRRQVYDLQYELENLARED